MKNFPKPLTVRLRPAEIAKAQNFAQQVVHTVNYRDSRQSNKAKIQNDHFISKLGEEAVRKAFEHIGQTVKGPDYSIYSAKQKSWDEDLYINSIALAVKTQKRSAAKKYGLSWTFQHSGKRKDPVLRQPEAWVCFVELNDEIKELYAVVYPALQIKQLVFKAPKLKYLVGKKKVVYAKDLKGKI